MSIHDKENWPVWATEKIEIVEPKKDWLEKGEQEKQLLLCMLKPLGIEEIEHYGSTSIPHLPSKPIIDLMAKIDSFDVVENEILSVLSTKNWHYVHPELDQRPWQRFFVKVKNDKRVAHLHLLLNDDIRWEEQKLFRDILRSEPLLIEEYAKIKKESAVTYSEDREQYTKSKSEFINRIITSG